MSVFAKIVTGVFGKKSDRDMKMLTPFIDEINLAYSSLESLSDGQLNSGLQPSGMLFIKSQRVLEKHSRQRD